MSKRSDKIAMFIGYLYPVLAVLEFALLLQIAVCKGWIIV